MGMDVYGRHPIGMAGQYFWNQIYWWMPLWEYCLKVAPEVAGKVKNGYSNDGDGLEAEDSRKLAAKLRTEVASGRTAKYAAKQRRIGRDFDEANVLCFAEFLEKCGGFKIW